jgi:DNA topoisomerase-1
MKRKQFSDPAKYKANFNLKDD